jgi:hypothetical protein
LLKNIDTTKNIKIYLPVIDNQTTGFQWKS